MAQCRRCPAQRAASFRGTTTSARHRQNTEAFARLPDQLLFVVDGERHLNRLDDFRPPF
jgi:hypothetical protein